MPKRDKPEYAGPGHEAVKNWSAKLFQSEVTAKQKVKVTSPTEFYVCGIRFEAGTYIIDAVEYDSTPIEF